MKTNTTEFKTAKTIKDYKVRAYGYVIVIPSGSTVTNSTACGNDNNYRYWVDFHKIAEHLTGFKNSTLSHDLTYYGINVPKECCESY